MRGRVVRAAVVAFIASFCTLAIELMAGRILAPYVGVSLYTWTSIIGVVLAGISAGAYAGGWLADRRPVVSTLGLLLLASGLCALLIVPVADQFAASDGLGTTLLQRVVILATLLFFVPSFFLGMISPVAVKLAVVELETAGRVVGRIYAVSTLGSIAGTFTTGFYLVAEFGTRSTLMGIGVILIATALLFGGLIPRLARAAVVLFLATVLTLMLFGPRSYAPPHQNRHPSAVDSGTIFEDESQYYTIKVAQTPSEGDGRPLQTLQLDHLVHSYTDLGDPAYFAYDYLRLFHHAMSWKQRQYSVAHLLFIGGGGYTLPRLAELTWPGALIDVAEIDPEVTRVAHRFFGLSRHTAIRTFNEDARWFIVRADARYDLVFIDAFNDLSVPYHLTTRQFAGTLRERLAGDGAIAANVIDNFARGRFLASYVKTLQSVFGSGNVAVILESEADMGDIQSTYVVVASAALGSLLASIDAERPILRDAELVHYVERRKGIVLTDDYVPVDNMLAPLFTERFADEVSE